MCTFCKNNEYKESVTFQTMEYNGKFVVVKNVPCLECTLCGEKFFTDEVMDRLESIFETVKKQIEKITLIDYKVA